MIDSEQNASSTTISTTKRSQNQHRHSNLSMTGSVSSYAALQQGQGQRSSYALSRRSSQSSLLSVRTVATSYSVNSSATSTSICSAKFDKAYANQAQKWTTTYPNVSRRPSMSSQYSLGSLRSVPNHIIGKGAMLQRELKAVETLLKDTPNLTYTETGTIGWMLMHERSLLKHAIKYDARAHSEWEASMDWRLSAHEGPVSKIFVTQPSRFGLTPAQHRHRLGQARTLENNALDLWRFSDLNYQEAYKLRGFREKLQAEQTKSTDGTRPRPVSADSKDKIVRKDFQTWLKEVSKNGAMKSVMVKDDGTLDKLNTLSLDEKEA